MKMRSALYYTNTLGWIFTVLALSVLASSAVDRGLNQRLKLVFVASPLSTQHLGERTDWLARNQDNVSYTPKNTNLKGDNQSNIPARFVSIWEEVRRIKC
jgi:hypothetical protein